MTALEVQGLCVRFGAVRAVQDVSFAIEPGQILGFIGPNGAGKTTVFDAISGLVPMSGSIRLGDREIGHVSPARRARAGLGRSFQDGRLFASLSVRETLALGFRCASGERGFLSSAVGLARRQENRIADQVDQLADRMGLAGYLDTFVSELSTGTRRIVDLSSVIAHRPSVLLLDEPSSGIAQRESEALGPLVRRVRDELDCSILIVEHDMPLVAAVADEVVAMELGQIICRDTPDAVVNDPRVVEAYLGGATFAIHRSGALPAASSDAGDL